MDMVARWLFGSDSWLVRQWRVMALLVVAATSSACSTWLDREVVERDQQADWVDADTSVRIGGAFELRHAAKAAGLYRLAGGELRHSGRTEERIAAVGDWWVGHIGAGGRNAVQGASDQFVLLEGDEVCFRWAGAAEPTVPLRLQLRRHIDIAVEELGSDESAVSFEEEGGRWTLAVSKAALARPSRRVQQVERRPTVYDAGNRTLTAEQLDRSEALQMALFPPAGIGRLVSRVLGSRMEEPSEYDEAVLDERSVETDETVACQLGVSGARYRWRLVLPDYESGAVAEVETLTSGRATIDFKDYIEIIDEKIDFGRVGRLQVTEIGTGREFEQTVDLLRIRDAARGSAAQADKAPEER